MCPIIPTEDCRLLQIVVTNVELVYGLEEIAVVGDGSGSALPVSMCEVMSNADIVQIGVKQSTAQGDRASMQEPSVDSNPNQVKDEHFGRTIELAERCVGEDNRPHPKVGVVIVKNGKVLAEAFRGEIGKGDHAEFIALERKSRGNAEIEGADLITTLEPCTRRSHDKRPCVSWIMSRRIRKVWIGTLDYNPDIRGEGEATLRDDGVLIGRFPDSLQLKILEQNRAFFDYIKSKHPSLSMSELQERADRLRELVLTELLEINKLGALSDEGSRLREFIRGAYERTLTLEPEDANRWTEIGWFLYNGTVYGPAGFAFQTSTKIDTTSFAAWLGRGMTEIEMYKGSPDSIKSLTNPLHRAMEYLEKAYSINSRPDNLHRTAWSALAEMWTVVKDLKRTEICRQRAKALQKLSDSASQMPAK